MQLVLEWSLWDHPTKQSLSVGNYSPTATDVEPTYGMDFTSIVVRIEEIRR